jgi:phosphoglycolate phosphatase
MLKESFPAEILTDNKLNEVISFFRKRYDASDFTMTNAFNGIDKIIYDTNNFIHHIVTNKPYYASQAILKKLGWTENISSFKTSSVQNGQRKSKKELFSEIIKESGAKTQSFFGIGDMKTDCIAAKENNITSIGVLWGSGTGEELSGYCDYFFEDSKKLYDYLLGILHEQQ